MNESMQSFDDWSTIERVVVQLFQGFFDWPRRVVLIFRFPRTLERWEWCMVTDHLYAWVCQLKGNNCHRTGNDIRNSVWGREKWFFQLSNRFIVLNKQLNSYDTFSGSGVATTLVTGEKGLEITKLFTAILLLNYSKRSCSDMCRLSMQCTLRSPSEVLLCNTKRNERQRNTCWTTKTKKEKLNWKMCLPCSQYSSISVQTDWLGKTRNRVAEEKHKFVSLHPSLELPMYRIDWNAGQDRATNEIPKQIKIDLYVKTGAIKSTRIWKGPEMEFNLLRKEVIAAGGAESPENYILNVSRIIALFQWVNWKCWCWLQCKNGIN